MLQNTPGPDKFSSGADGHASGSGAKPGAGEEKHSVGDEKEDGSSNASQSSARGGICRLASIHARYYCYEQALTLIFSLANEVGSNDLVLFMGWEGISPYHGPITSIRIELVSI